MGAVPPVQTAAHQSAAAVSASPAATHTGGRASAAEQLADGMVAQVHTVSRDGATEFRMRLDPPELGRVHVRLVSSGDEVRGQVLVADEGVRRMIESQLPELRQRLEQAGVPVQRLDVGLDTAGGGGGGPRRDPVPAAPEPPVARVAQREARAAVARTARGSVDVTV